MFKEGRYWHKLEDGRIQCDVCPRYCKLSTGQRGLCSVRGNFGDGIALLSYGQASGFCIDPIEKKPLNHFYPGTPILSFGQTGCNLTCKFCQNYSISKANEKALESVLQRASTGQVFDKLNVQASPERITEACVQTGCRSIAFTYNDPVIFLEYAVDVAKACRARGIKCVAVTAGYIAPDARREFFSHMDGANIDLKSFNPDFYHKLCSADLETVLETLVYLKHETNVWFELTDLIIPAHNDSMAEIDAMTKWVVKELGPDVPMHFSAFHPDWKMMDVPHTPLSTLQQARNIALRNGISHVYTGNVHDPEGDKTHCGNCKTVLIERDWFEIKSYHLDEKGRCPSCKEPLVGCFDLSPGTWGRKRQPIRFSL